MYNIFCLPEAVYLTWENVYGMSSKMKITFVEKPTADAFISMLKEMEIRQKSNRPFFFAGLVRPELYDIMWEDP